MKFGILKNRLRLSCALLKRKKLYGGVPQEIIVEVTNRCNLRCLMCVRTYRDIKEKDLSLDEFGILLENIPFQTEQISFAGLGEPLLNPGLSFMIEQCQKRGLKSVLYTNAVLLNARPSTDLIKAGLSAIVISFDGADASTYEYYRRGAKFAEVRSNILNFLKIKRTLGSSVTVEMQLIILKRTIPEIKSFLRVWSLPGINSVRIKNDHMRVLKEDDLKDSVILAKRQGMCAMPWRGPATIDVKGDVYPCCVGSEHNLILGNIFKESMECLWNSSLANELRSNFAVRGFKLSSCKGCYIPLPPLFFCVSGTLINPSLVHRALASIERAYHLKIRKVTSQ